MITIAFTGGGTGGHIYPGLAVAERLRERFGGECRIFWIGSNNGRDGRTVEGAGVEFFGIPSGRLRRYFSLKTLPDMFRVAAGFFAARNILKKQKADILFSKGGFVSVPPCAAAASLGLPVCTHESDFSPGLATKLNLRFVQKTGGMFFIAYAETVRFLSGGIKDSLGSRRIITSGNPVRGDFRRADPEKGRAFLGVGKGERILLVLGGSQGAREINLFVAAALNDLCLSYTVVHQYGPEQGWTPPEADGYIPLPYINEEMPHVLAAAELVVGRSGAGTVWESAVLGKPMILVPLCGGGTRGDQVENARFFEKEGAALVLCGCEATAENLVNTVKLISEDSSRRLSMAEAARRIGALDGAAIIGDSICTFMEGSGRLPRG